MAEDLRDLLRSVGYIVVEQSEGAGAHVVIAGKDDGEAAAASSNAGERLVVVLRPGHSFVPPPGLHRRQLVEGNGSVSQILERLAIPLNLEIRTDVFVSYARADSGFADTLTAALIENGRRPWVDRRELLPSEQWQEALRRGIEASEVFLFIATPTSIASHWCTQELAWADEWGKRIIPVVRQPVDPGALPGVVRDRQRIDVAPEEPPERCVDAVVLALDRDPDIVRLHRDLLRKALAWKDDRSQVLRGRELALAEDWLTRAGAVRDPRPTRLHAEFIAASRGAQRSRQRSMRLGAAAVLIILSALTAWALLSARQARSRLAEQHAFGSYVAWDTDPERAFLLADAAMRTAPIGDPLRVTYEAMMRNLLQQIPESVTNLETGVSSAAIAPDLSHVVGRAEGKHTFIAPLTGFTGRRVALPDEEPFLQYQQQTLFSADGRWIAAIVRPFFGEVKPYRLVVWRASDGQRIGTVDLSFLPGERAPEAVAFNGDGRKVLIQAGGRSGYDAYVLDVAQSDQHTARSLFHAPSLLLLGQVDVASSTAVVTTPESVRLIDAFTGEARSETLRFQEQVLRASLARGGRSVVVSTASHLSSWTLHGRSLEPVGNPMEANGNDFVWDVSADGTLAALLGPTEGYPAELWSFPNGSRVTIPVTDRIKTPYVMKAGEEYKPLSFVGDHWLVAREPLRDPLSGGTMQQLLLFDRETVELAAAPFFLSTSYLALVPLHDTTRFAVVSKEGLVQVWDLLRRPLPHASPLHVPDLLLHAEFTASRDKLVTLSRVKVPTGYAARLDVWNVTDGKPAGRIGELFDVRTEWCQSENGQWLATASGGVVTLWGFADRRSKWKTPLTAPIESMAFRDGDRRLATAGISDDDQRQPIVTDIDTATGHVIDGNRRPKLAPNPVHVAFSADGTALIADYEYNAIAFADVLSGQSLGAAYPFVDAAGLPFELAYEIVLNLRHVQPTKNGELTGELPGRTAVSLRREGAGTTVLPAGGDTPVLSAFVRGDVPQYPVRGAGLISPSGRWFALASNITTVDRASALRIYDFASGYPITDSLLHFAASRPDQQWPRLLSRLQSDLDPIVALAYLEDSGTVVTITTNGVLRHWPVLRDPRRRSLWSSDADLAVAVTGKRLLNARSVQRVPQRDYADLRSKLQVEIDRLRNE